MSIVIAANQHLLGLRLVRSMLDEASAMRFMRAKLSDQLFKAEELAVFQFVAGHLAKYTKLPKLETVVQLFPIMAEITAPEGSKYYADLIEKRFAYDVLNHCMLEVQTILKSNKMDSDPALKTMRTALGKVIEQKYRMRLTDFGVEGKELLLKMYKQTLAPDNETAIFGWPYMDEQTGGVLPGDVMSVVGRPATGKSWLIIFFAICNWLLKKTNTAIVSMEMNTMAIAQRLGAMYTKLPPKQLKNAAFSNSTLQNFVMTLNSLDKEPAKLYIIDGNLAASAEEVYALAYQLGCVNVLIDGAYLMKHPNARLDRFTRVAENVELMKKFTSELDMSTFASWQFGRTAAKKDVKKGEKAGLDDIGYSDAIGQVSSVVIGLMQEEGNPEAILSRKVQVLKGRNGETGEFEINWKFQTCDFTQYQKSVKFGADVDPSTE